jgi:hypothetical protein
MTACGFRPARDTTLIENEVRQAPVQPGSSGAFG